MPLSVVELCAGGGGQAIGLERAGYEHAAVVEYEPLFCATLRLNRPEWNTLQMDLRQLRARDYKGVDLLAAGVPCPPFSVAGKQLGPDDDRDMFPHVLDIIDEARPRAVLIENVPGLATSKFDDYRSGVLERLRKLGYHSEWTVLQASDFGAPQLRPRFVLVAIASGAAKFSWPIPTRKAPTVGEALLDLMASEGWKGARAWALAANQIAPTLVGGSKKHGGPDLGPSRAKASWRALGVDGLGIADSPPKADAPLGHMPRLTLRMAARIQTFPDDWQFFGGKTASYRQIGNAFPSCVAEAVGKSLAAVLKKSAGSRVMRTGVSQGVQS